VTDHYELMGVEPGASKDEIRDAYRHRLDDLKVQAENGRSDKIRDAARAETRELNKAWQVLSDPFQRERYDAALADGAAGDDDVIDVEEASSNGATATPPARGLRRLFEPRPSADRSDRPTGGAREPRARGERRPPEGVEGAEAAPLGRRLAAMGIDLAVVGGLYLAIVNLAALLLDPDDNAAAYVAVVISVVFIVFFVYFAVMTARTGQTLGKRLTHIMAVDVNTGNLPSMRRATLRYLVPIVFLLALPGSLGALIALLFGFSWALLDTRVGLMDRLGQTRVVVARYQPGPASR
jgi:uncharacterized RDD family membrane protein YckC